MNCSQVSSLLSLYLDDELDDLSRKRVHLHVQKTERLSKWLRFIPIAILSTLIAPTILAPQGFLNLSFHNSYLLAGITSVGVALKTRNVIFTVVIGMAVILLLRAVLRWT